MTRTIQQAIYAAIPLDGDGVTMADLCLHFRLHKTSLQNALSRLLAMGLIQRNGRRPTLYRRIADAPCPPDRRGRSPASHTKPSRKNG